MGLKEEVVAFGAGVQAALKAKEYDKFKDMHTKDCLIAFPGKPFIKKYDIKPFMEKVLLATTSEFCPEIIDVTELCPEFVVVRGTMTHALMGHVVTAWVVVVLKKDEGIWKIHTRAVGPTEFPEGFANKK